MKLSIVIPLYNSEKYISSTIKSIIKNNSQEFQVILIDDGSTDKSYNLCKSFAERDNRIKLLHKKNGGVSSARNYGISHSDGQYIWFLDSDDLAEAHAIDAILEQITRSDNDVFFSNARILNKDGNISYDLVQEYDENLANSLNNDELISYLFSDLKMTWVIWRHIFKKDFIVENSLWFNEKLRMFEDTDWILLVLLSVRTFAFIKDSICLYRFHNLESLTHQEIVFDTFEYTYETCVKWFNYFKNTYQGSAGRNAILCKLSDDYKRCFVFVMRLKGREQNKALNMFMKHLYIVNYNKFSDFNSDILKK